MNAEMVDNTTESDKEDEGQTMSLNHQICITLTDIDVIIIGLHQLIIRYIQCPNSTTYIWPL